MALSLGHVWRGCPIRLVIVDISRRARTLPRNVSADKWVAFTGDDLTRNHLLDRQDVEELNCIVIDQLFRIEAHRAGPADRRVSKVSVFPNVTSITRLSGAALLEENRLIVSENAG